MKYRALGAVIAVLGALTMATPRYIFPVCGMGAAGAHAKPGYHKCHGTMHAETATGAAIMALGLIPIVWAGRKGALAASAGAMAGAALVAAFPLFITGICKMPTMACRKGTLPGLITAAVLLALAGTIGAISNWREKP